MESIQAQGLVCVFMRVCTCVYCACVEGGGDEEDMDGDIGRQSWVRREGGGIEG